MDDDKTDPVRRDGKNMEWFADDSKHCSEEDWEAIYSYAQEEYKTNKKRFVDEFFPSNDLNTICDLNNGFDRLTQEQKQFFTEIQWRRVPQIFFDKSPRLFSKPFKPAAIMQGRLGDCYLLSTFSVFANKGLI